MEFEDESCFQNLDNTDPQNQTTNQKTNFKEHI